MTKPLNLLQEHVNGLWQHATTGRFYQVMTVANRETTRPDEFPITVVYQDIVSGAIWCRPVDVFVERCLPWHDKPLSDSQRGH